MKNKGHDLEEQEGRAAITQETQGCYQCCHNPNLCSCIEMHRWMKGVNLEVLDKKGLHCRITGGTYDVETAMGISPVPNTNNDEESSANTNQDDFDENKVSK